MSANKQTRNRNLRKPTSDFQRLSRRFMSSALRSLFLLNKSTRYSRAGFVLPTTVLLLLVMTLTVGALTFRSVSRTQSAILAREQQVIDNIAAPAADRGKAKLEYLFDKDTRIPGTSTPSSDVLATLMLNINNNSGVGNLGITALPKDPYTLPDETRIDINNDGTVDNAWSFSFDLNGDGNPDPNEVIAYSLLMDDSVDPRPTPTPTRDDDVKLEDTGTAATIQKAKYLVTRNGPINTNNTVSNCGGSRAPAQGWLTVSNAALEKNFQITAFVSNGKNPGRANSAFELQQVRLAQRGNTWGAWFKYDMEIHPGEDFNWNGAIHTDGNLFVTNKFKGHMISSHNSCLYAQNSSDVTMAEVDNDGSGVNVKTAGSKDFQGQLIAGAPTYGDLNSRGTPDFHIFTTLNAAPTIGTNLTTSNDSVTGNSFNNLLDIALDPVALFTQNISRHRRTGTWTRDTDWNNSPFKAGGRVINQNQVQPFLDDFYRADNRYGPRPNYANYNWVTSTDGGGVNTTRSSVDYDKRLGDEILSTDPRADNLTNETDGLDGYWERKAISNGMRVIVGQRLELGNPNGWNSNLNGETTDPLYPPTLSNSLSNKQRQRVTLRDNLSAVQGMVVYHYGINNGGRYPLACIANTVHPGTLQTLRASRTFNINSTGKPKLDFFEGKGTNGWEFSFPTAFDTETNFGSALKNDQPLGIALRNLAYFAGDPNGGSPSFLPVQDTNVHPFAHQAMWGDFSVLRRIFKDELDNAAWRSATNPPQLTTMTARYSALSPADKSSLHSAACTMGLLAYNVNNTLSEYESALSGSGSLQNVGVAISQLIDGTSSNGNPEIEDLIPGAQSKGSWVDPRNTVFGTTCPATGANSDMTGFQANCDTAEYYQQFTTDDWVEAYRLSASPTPSASDVEAVKNAISAIKFGGQLIRDRALGFLPGNSIALDTLTGGNNNVTWDPITGLTDQQQIGNADVVVQISCDPDIFNQVTNGNGGGGGGGGGGSNRSRVGLSLMACSAQNGAPIKYPSLYYLFPMVNHDHDGAPATGEASISPAFVVNHSQPTGEEYINRITGYGVNAGFIYRVLKDIDGDNIENNSEKGYADIAFLPRASDPTSTTATDKWKLPATPATPVSSGVLNPESMNIKVINGAIDTNVSLSFLDKAMYNGREEMTVRVLDVDLQKLTRYKNGGASGDYWISNTRDTANGILYAVREDAVREDTVIRPASTANWTSCDTLSELLSTNCRMLPSRTVANGGPSDPPLSRRDSDGSPVGISVKPVDFAPDPDRRPNGFRLNANLDSNNGDLSNRAELNLPSPNEPRTKSFTFVTDNTAYIKGKFNPHTSNGTDSLEEFTQTLSNPGGGNVAFGLPFYNGRTTSNLSKFSTATVDRWRVAEVLADAVSLLSDNYVDGSVQEGFIRNRSEVSTDFKNAANANSITSFHDQQRPVQETSGDSWGGVNAWYRTNGGRGDTGGDTAIPIWVGRNGESMVFVPANGATPENDKVLSNAERDADFELPDERNQSSLIAAATPGRINATIIAGLIPSRGQQAYGGLNNFPRFLENWNANDLFIQGAFLQLNFSTSATAPFDIDAWNPGDTPIDAERILYYSPPARRWGYDVGLQFAPAGPIAERFVAIGRPRSEHYRELPIEDPYVTNLRCSKVRPTPTGSFARRFPNEVCPP